MGEAKRRRELGHMLRQNTYTFIVSPGPQVQHLGPLPIDKDDEFAVQHAIEPFGPDADDWERAVDIMLTFRGVDDLPSTPTHLRCELFVERTRNGGRVHYSTELFPFMLAYSLDNGHTWNDLPRLTGDEDESEETEFFEGG